jgi:glycosyltransferase involved in cell wall biosynthesis
MQDLAQKIIKILSDENLREKLSENALSFSYNFDWDKAAEQTEKYLESLL